MKIARWLPLVVLAVAAAGVVTGLVLTRTGAGDAPAGSGRWGFRGRRMALVDETPLKTARALEPLVEAREERPLTRQATRLANHEVDLAYADALRQAALTPPPDTPEVRSRLARKAQAQAALQAGQKIVADLTAQLAAAGDRAKQGIQVQLDLAKAQQELDQDEVDQATVDLIRVGGDPQARVRYLQNLHAAQEATQAPAPPAQPTFQSGSLLGKLEAWSAHRNKHRRLVQARQEALDKAQALTRERDAWAGRVAQEQQARARTQQAAANLAQSRPDPADPSAQSAASSALNSLQKVMGDQHQLTDLGRRIQDQQDLAEVYASWVAVAGDQRRAALHDVMQWLGGILLILAVVMLADRLFERLFIHLVQGNRRVGRLLKVVKFIALAAGTIAILLVVFGPPSQLTTLFGLAGAGLTVALKDFIVAFFGWFVLVGRDGIHVGDWVEINGVSGEVVEIGLLRTRLLETGSGSEGTHPTGRVASFVNSFAIEGHFFNFSTTGQWMWDELQVTIPAGQDPFPLLDRIRARVEQETGANAGQAEQEWRQSTGSRRAQRFSARPGIQMVPAGDGAVEIRIRYITRAYERSEKRRVLNLALVELLHGRPGEAPAPLPG